MLPADLGRGDLRINFDDLVQGDHAAGHLLLWAGVGMACDS